MHRSTLIFGVLLCIFFENIKFPQALESAVQIMYNEANKTVRSMNDD